MIEARRDTKKPAENEYCLEDDLDQMHYEFLKAYKVGRIRKQAVGRAYKDVYKRVYSAALEENGDFVQAEKGIKIIIDYLKYFDFKEKALESLKRDLVAKIREYAKKIASSNGVDGNRFSYVGSASDAGIVFNHYTKGEITPEFALSILKRTLAIFYRNKDRESYDVVNALKKEVEQASKISSNPSETIPAILSEIKKQTLESCI